MRVVAHLRAFFKKMVHLRDFPKYAFAHIFFPGKRYDCAYWILLNNKMTRDGFIETMNELCIISMVNFVSYKVLRKVNDSCHYYFAHPMPDAFNKTDTFTFHLLIF